MPSTPSSVRAAGVGAAASSRPRRAAGRERGVGRYREMATCGSNLARIGVRGPRDPCRRVRQTRANQDLYRRHGEDRSELTRRQVRTENCRPHSRTSRDPIDRAARRGLSDPAVSLGLTPGQGRYRVAARWPGPPVDRGSRSPHDAPRRGGGSRRLHRAARARQPSTLGGHHGRRHRHDHRGEPCPRTRSFAVHPIRRRRRSPRPLPGLDDLRVEQLVENSGVN